jgi:DNA-binding NtrC family response regulator
MGEASSREAPAKQILIVDDDRDSCEVLAEVLNEEGFQSKACTNAEQALDLLRQGKFQALLTDAVMPDISGVELVKRALAVDSRLRCVVLSGYSRPEGVSLPWLRKPINVDALLMALREEPASTSFAAEQRGQP